MGTLKVIFIDLIHFTINHIVTHIPIWCFRKMIYLSCGLKIGKNSRILMGTVIYYPWNISIGSNSYINENCILDGRGGITIEDNVSISFRTMLITGSHDVDSDNFSYRASPIIISRNSWAGAGSVVLPGASFEKGVVLSSGSVAKRGKYRANGMYSGVPAIYIKQRNISDDFLPPIWKPRFR